MTRKPGFFGATLAFILAMASCGKTLSNLESGARCSLNSDCKSPLVCGFERCRTECRTSRDCGGKLCVRSSEGANVCQLDDEVQCTHNSQCPGTQLCGPDRRCRDVCITNKDCVTDLLCVSRVCAKPDELVDGKLPQSTPLDAGSACTYATDCPGELVCLHGSCDVECLGDKDCLVGWSCRPQALGGDGRCYPNAGARDAEGDVVSDARSDATDATSDASDASDAGDASDGSGGLPRPLALAVGDYHSCALLASGKVKCFGTNTNGELGLGDTQQRGDSPLRIGDALPYVDLGTGRTAKALTAGQRFTCAILDNDKVKCWGINNFGQLGQGDTSDRGDAPGEMGDALPFIDLGAGRTAKSVSAGRCHACAVLDNDKVKCWGCNAVGRLGLGDTANRGDGAGEMGDALPYVDLGTGRTARAALAAEFTSCVLLDNNQAKCWGAGGQIGLGDMQTRGDAPGEMGDALPIIDLGTGRSVKRLASGLRARCAILDNDFVKCWGDGSNGSLGSGAVATLGDAPGEMGDALPYLDLGAGRTAVAVTLGGFFGCAILDNGKMKCWGVNTAGQIGLGDTITRGDGPCEMGDSLPYVDLGTGLLPALVVAGAAHSCARFPDDSVKCWGGNGDGRLGTGEPSSRGLAPNEMGDNLPFVKLVGP